MKTCKKCGLIKPIDNFVKRNDSKDGYRSLCKECAMKISRLSYKKNPLTTIRSKHKSRERIKEIIQQAKNVPCKDCGISYPYYVMDFDHLNNKKFSISQSTHERGIFQIQEEIKKCEVICSNCHRIRTFNRKNLIDGYHKGNEFAC